MPWFVNIFKVINTSKCIFILYDNNFQSSQMNQTQLDSKYTAFKIQTVKRIENTNSQKLTLKVAINAKKLDS